MSLGLFTIFIEKNEIHNFYTPTSDVCYLKEPLDFKFFLVSFTNQAKPLMRASLITISNVTIDTSLRPSVSENKRVSSFRTSHTYLLSIVANHM